MTTDKELLKNLEGGDCPAELIDLLEGSQSKWRKGVIKQFIADHIWKTKQEKDITHIKRLVWAIFSIVVIGLVSQYFVQYILPFMS